MNRIVKAILIICVSGLLAAVSAGDEKSSEISGELIVFHAGSLSVPFKQICEEFNKHYPKMKILQEVDGSRTCARKISDLGRQCDIMASADYTVIDKLLIGEHADWNIKFASNEMVIAFRADSRGARRINKSNWYKILLEKDIAFGRSDPNSDPCGYRSMFVMKLAEKYYNKPGLAAEMAGKDQRYIRSKEVDLLALLEVGELDYIFIYRSVAQQHGLEIVTLPDAINLKKSKHTLFYKMASVRLTGKKPGASIEKKGEPIVYGVTIPKNSQNRKAALAFLDFLLEADKGGTILEKNGQTFIVPSPTESFDKVPASLKKYAAPIEKEKR